MNVSEHPAVLKTKQWLEEIVIGLNFCPFAKKEFVNNTIRYQTSRSGMLAPALQEVADELTYLADHAETETTLLIFATGFRQFEKYLDLVDYANELLIDLGYEGEFQIASFHPEYLFDGEDEHSPANYTNRSPYPTLHLIREQSMEKVLSVYPEPESIPDNNITLANEKGVKFFKQFLAQLHKM